MRLRHNINAVAALYNKRGTTYNNKKNKCVMEKKNIFSAIVNATGKNFEIEKSVSGYYRLLLDGEPIIDDSACEDVNGDYDTAVDYFSNYLLEYEVPEDKKIMRAGVWFLVNKIKLYKVNVYQAYRADEEGVRWFTYKPTDTDSYKHEILEEVEKELPTGIFYDDESMTFSDNGHDCQMVNENDGSVSLVSSERIVNWF